MLGISVTSQGNRGLERFGDFPVLPGVRTGAEGEMNSAPGEPPPPVDPGFLGPFSFQYTFSGPNMLKQSVPIDIRLI